MHPLPPNTKLTRYVPGPSDIEWATIMQPLALRPGDVQVNIVLGGRGLDLHVLATWAFLTQTPVSTQLEKNTNCIIDQYPHISKKKQKYIIYVYTYIYICISGVVETSRNRCKTGMYQCGKLLGNCRGFIHKTNFCLVLSQNSCGIAYGKHITFSCSQPWCSWSQTCVFSW